MEVRNIPLSQIRENPDAIRKCRPESDEFLALKKAIYQEGGLLQNISVVPRTETNIETGVSSQYFLLVNGLQRFTAYKMLQAEYPNDKRWEEIMAGIMEDRGDLERATTQLVANFNVKMLASEITNHLGTLLTYNPSWTMEQLAAQVSQQKSWCERFLNLRKLDADTLRMVDDGLISVSNATVLVKLPPEERANFLDRARTEKSNEFGALVNNRLNELKQATREGREAKPEEFALTPKVRTSKELLNEYESMAYCRKFIGAGLAESDLIKKVLAWVVELDDESYVAKKTKYDETIRQKEAKKEAKKQAKLKELGIVIPS